MRQKGDHHEMGLCGQNKPLSITLNIGNKENVGNAYFTDVVCPEGVSPEIKVENDNVMVYLLSQNVGEAGTFGFCLRSDKSGVTPITFVFGVKKMD